ncbi:MAG: hypothetical protein H7296_07150, partial [Bacteroidia bacterium]|nr:hypothetical protein [Bacteroidia bacterium]
MKHKIVLSFFIFSCNLAYSQWIGPSSGILTTNNSIKIEHFGLTTGPTLPLLSLSHDPGTGTYFPLHVTHDRVGIGTTNPLSAFHIGNGGSFLMTRTS